MGCSGSTQIGFPHKRVSSQLNDLQKKNIKEGGIEYSQFIMCNRGKITDYYEIEKNKLGEGSYGSVSKARNKETCAARAIKSIPKSKMKNFEQFKREISIMKLMDHPNIIKLYETFEDHRCLYLVMELCTGGELFDRIIEAGHFTEVQAALLMQQLIRAVHYMHKLDVCHRDLKPENFLFKSKEESVDTNILKIIDFGLSCVITPNVKLTTKAGTPYYVAPEVLSGRYDHTSDLWSCGVIMYVLLCGYPPFFGENDAEVLTKVRAGNVQFTKAEWGKISKDAKDLIKSLLNMDTSSRATASDALETTWITQKAPKATDVSLDAGFVENLRGFRSQNKLKKVAMNVIANRLDDENIKALRDMFTRMDKNDDGILSITELKNGIEACLKKDEEIPADLQALLESIDSDNSGSIEYREFIAATMERKIAGRKDMAWQAFREFDKNMDGRIEKAELEEVLKSMGHSKEDTTAIMEEVDKDKDGAIDFDEFFEMMKSKQ